MGDLFALALETEITGMCNTPSKNMSLDGNKVGEGKKTKHDLCGLFGYQIWMQ